MFLKRVQVPNFRALKNVDISFEPDFNPTIFPLGSLNGGGKSTLLQLIFVLLTCSSDPEKHIYIQNMLEGAKFKDGNNKLITIELGNSDEYCLLDFSVFILPKEIGDYNESEYGIVPKYREYIKLSSARNTLQQEIVRNANKQGFLERKSVLNSAEKVSLEEIKKLISNLVVSAKGLVDKIEELVQNIEASHHSIIYGSVFNKDKEVVLLLDVDSSTNKESISIDNSILKSISSKVFLAAPFTQVFRFLDQSTTLMLFRGGREQARYYSEFVNTKNKLPNFFTYDILPVNYIIDFFKVARDDDFKQAIKTGEYGDKYQSVLGDLNSLLENKKINLDFDLSGINFITRDNGEEQQLYPADLSHGELKRLSIYVWLKHLNIKNSIVLMDEIENAFHPDWQHQIISDLAEWGASNQFILATHSYELCNALTPAHVKEIEPRLIPEEETSN